MQTYPTEWDEEPSFLYTVVNAAGDPVDDHDFWCEELADQHLTDLQAAGRTGLRVIMIDR